MNNESKKISKERAGTTASVSLGREVDEAIDRLDKTAEDLREYEAAARDARREVRYAQDETKRVLIANNILDALKIDMTFIRKHSQNK